MTLLQNSFINPVRSYKQGKNKNIKNLITITLLFFTVFSFAQTKEITKLLNKQFKAEQKMYDEFDQREKPTLVQPFQIKNDTLSFEYSIRSYADDDYIIYTKREVHLKDVKEFIKDINVIFIANPKSVKETSTTKNPQGKIIETSNHFTYMFFTELRKDNYDDFLRKPMIDAFSKAGYEITSEDWYN